MAYCNAFLKISIWPDQQTDLYIPAVALHKLAKPLLNISAKYNAYATPYLSYY